MATWNVNKSGKFWLNTAWEDAPHLDNTAIESMLNEYGEHERATRARGLPMMGTGLVFPIHDDDISVKGFEIPAHWARVAGCDFGIDHPAAGVALAIDRDSDTVYLYACYKKSGETAVYHAQWFKGIGDWIPVAWPHDGIIRDKGTGQALKNQYRQHGASMMKEHAAYKDERTNSVEAGLTEMLEYMRAGKFKVFDTCQAFFQEKSSYHRKDSQVVKLNDDIICAARYAFVMRRYARTRAEHGGGFKRRAVAHQPIAGRRAA